jgi:methyl-accepting chemotaxis protein
MVDGLALEAQAGDDDERHLCAWLDELTRTRDFVTPLQSGGARARDAELEAFVQGLRAEMLEFREIVDSAAGVAEVNAAQLAGIVENTNEQRTVVESAAAAIAEIDRGAAHVAETTEGLRAVAQGIAASTSGYDAGIERVLDALRHLRTTVGEAAEFATATEHSAAGIVAFLDRLRRIARQARLLAINAAIEAAHLGDLGRGFVIVADQIKNLSASTADSAQNVSSIHKELHESSSRVERAIADSSGILDALDRDLQDVRAGSARAQAGITDLDGAINDVATIAAEQSANLSSIAGGVDALAKFAEDAARAAERAGRLELGAGIAQLKETIGRYRLGERLAAPPAPVSLAHRSPALVAAAERLRARVDADQREILTAIMGVAVSIARNSYEWKAIAASLDGLQKQLAATTNAIEETAAGADIAGVASRRMRTSLDTMRESFGKSVDELQRALDRVDRIRETVAETDASVTATTSAAERAAAILDLIDSISSETTLLSFNAAIESAHAGDAGSGFGIIANEIRMLAEGTSQSTQEIAAVIGGIADASRAMRATSGSAGRQAAAVQTETAGVQETINVMRREIDSTFERATEVAGVVDQQLAALANVRHAAEIAAQRVRSDTATATDSRRIELAMLGMRAHTLAARRPLGIVAEAIRTIGLNVAAKMDGVFDAAIASGAIRLEDCFDTDYVPIVGAKIAELRRLFDVSRVPATGFDPPKFATRYDRAVEDGFNALIDAAVPEHPAIKAMFAVDLNGYCFGHFHQCRKDWTGDYVRDLNDNRIKRFFEDELSLRCSRVGLGPASDSLPKRTPYATFRDRGCSLVRTEPRPWAIFTYARDTGIVYNDLSVSLFAQGKRVATIRIIYDADVV